MKKTESQILNGARDWLFLLVRNRRGKDATEIERTRLAFEKIDKLLGLKHCKRCYGKGLIDGAVLESGPCNSDWRYKQDVCGWCLGYGYERKPIPKRERARI